MSGNNGKAVFDVLKARVEAGEKPTEVVQVGQYTDANGLVSEDRLFVALYTYELHLPKEDRDLSYVKAWDLTKRDFRTFEVDRMEDAQVVGEFTGEIDFRYPQMNGLAGKDPIDPSNTPDEVLANLAPNRWNGTPKHLRRWSKSKGLDAEAVNYF